jgi:hypothetical protein
MQRTIAANGTPAAMEQPLQVRRCCRRWCQLPSAATAVLSVPPQAFRRWLAP